MKTKQSTLTFLTLIWQMSPWFMMELPLTKRIFSTIWHCSCIRMTVMKMDVSFVFTSSISWSAMPLSWFWMRQFPREATFMIWLIMLSFRSTTLTQVWSFLSSSAFLVSVELTLMKLLKSFPMYVHIPIIQFWLRHLKNGQSIIWKTLFHSWFRSSASWMKK